MSTERDVSRHAFHLTKPCIGKANLRLEILAFIIKKGDQRYVDIEKISRMADETEQIVILRFALDTFWRLSVVIDWLVEVVVFVPGVVNGKFGSKSFN